MKRIRRKKKYRDIDPDDIFLDSENLSNLNQQQFEGVIEKPISQRALFFLGGVFLFLAIIFLIKVGYMQIVRGDYFLSRSESNRLHSISIFSERGIIYDRNNIELAWNDLPKEGEPFFRRKTIDKPGFAHLLGYVVYPKKDNKGFYWRNEISGQSGIESIYNELVAGENGKKIIEVDAQLNPTSENTVSLPVDGENLILTIDALVQEKLYKGIQRVASESDFQGGTGIVMNLQNGEILAMTNYPEYDLEAMSSGDTNKINSYINDIRKPFLNRAISGLYTPGSVVKPFIALAALEEDLITRNTTVNSIGKIEVPNRYFPDQKSIFRDYRPEGHGITNVEWAIADSVNTFFYSIGGGYKGQRGLGIEKINDYMKNFKLSDPTGIGFLGEVVGTVPSPEWKEQIFKERWYLGDTYNTSIGQFGFQLTPIRAITSISALVNGGIMYTPILVSGEKSKIDIVNFDLNNAEIVKSGMRQAVTKGTAQILNVPYLRIAAKTGTAQVGTNNEFRNSWSLGFFPYENPKYAFVVVMDRGKSGGRGSASLAMRYTLDELMLEGFEWE